MASTVRISSMALRLFWLINLALGIYIAYIATGNARPWVITHVFTGVLIVALLWFLGIAQALVKGGSLLLTGATFVVGLALALIGMFQVGVSSGAGLYVLQGLHVLLVLSAIALGEICAARYRKGLAAQAA
jgi:hypothetical protein